MPSFNTPIDGCDCPSCNEARNRHAANEHPAVAEFRHSLYENDGTTGKMDKEFAAAVRATVSEVITTTNAPGLFKFLENVRVYGCDPEDNEKSALADYDRLIAAQQRTTEHPDIAAYREAARDGVTTDEQDESFIRAIFTDPRIVDVLVNRDWDNTVHASLCREVSNFLSPSTDDDVIDDDAAIAAYDAIVGNTTPIAEQIDTANAKLGDSLNAMARTLDTLSEEFRRIADSLG